MIKTVTRRAFKRKALIERLERRDLLAANPFGTNPLQRYDVSRNGEVSPLDALRVINAIALSDNGIADPAKSIGNFIDVNGDSMGTPLDALHVLNVLALDIPLVAATLPNDSAPGGVTNLDLVSNDYRVDLQISSGKLGNQGVFARIDGSGNAPFTEITSEFTASKASLSTQTLDAIAGGPLADGDHRFEIRVGADGNQIGFDLTIDRAAPMPQLLVDSTVRRTFDSAQLDLGESVSTTIVPTSFDLTIDGGSQHGQSIPIRSISSIDDATLVLSLFQSLPDESYRLKTSTTIEDVAGNVLAADTEIATFLVADPPNIGSTSPSAGEELVSVTRRTIVRFDEPVDASTVTSDAFYLIANGERVDGSIRVSSTERFATFFYDDPLPASTEIRVVVDGSKIIGRDGIALDADGDDEPGGVQHADFRTLPLTPVPGTGVFGFVKDSNTGEPIVGATIRVDSLPDKNVVTDVNGRFELTDMPAPEFFVHIDGTTATNLPAGFVYPNVGKPFHSQAGRLLQLNMAGTPFDIYLPPLKETDIQALSATESTMVGFGGDGRARLEQILPETDPTLFDEFSLTIEPGAAIDDAGTPATTAAIIPVEPDRIPAPLPSFLDPQLVVSIQTPGANSFDVPAAITFPNFDGLAPGEKSSIFSFDHDAGKWKIVGTGTVSEDGRRIVSDGGVIEAPGWHLARAGSLTKGGYKDFGQGQASVTISGLNRIFTAENQEAQIVISNTSTEPVKAEVVLDRISTLTKTKTDKMSLDLGPKESKTIDLKSRKITAGEISALQDEDPNTNHAKIYTGTVQVTATSEGAQIGDETFLYALIVAEDAKLAFPNVLKEEDSQPAADEKKVLHVDVVGPIQDMSFAGDDEDIEFKQSSGSASFSVLSTELLDRLQSPSGELTLSHKSEDLPAIPVNAADAIQLDPFAIRRVSGGVTGDINKRFTIEGKVEIGLAGPTFDPLFAIDGTFEVNEEFFLLSGSITTNLLEDIPGFGPEVFLTEKDKKVLRINRMTKEFELFPSKDVPGQPPKENAFVLAGLKFTLTELFLPQSGVGLGLKGKITLPDKLGNVEIDIGSGENSDNSVIITRNDVDLTGAKVEFPDQAFTLFDVQAEATELSLEFQKRGVDDLGIERGNRFLLRGQLELLFPEFDPKLRIAASFASPDDEEALVDLSDSLGVAWSFALEEEPDLATIDAKADSAPEAEDPPDDSFIRLEFKPDGSLGLDAVGRIALETWKVSRLLTIEDVFLQIDTVNDNFLGFGRILTPFKKAGEITALVGLEGGKLDLIAVVSGTVRILVGNGDGSFDDPISIPAPVGALGVSVADLNGDGLPDIVIGSNLTSGTPAFSLQQVDGSFAAFQDLVPGHLSGAAPNAVVTADLNDDNRTDVISSNQDSDDVTVILQNSLGGFFVAATLSVGDSPRDVLADDINGDGNVDLVISNRFDGAVSVYLGDGDGTFADELRFSTGGNPMEMALADFNEDGLLDLAVIDTLAKDIVVLLNQAS
ncbi:FG-GAP repeat protein [Stieleria maiorica]|uniref:FG-GAP repeat protein n=1 Tax=Stieleria maiorica TaxID=2795974 RepID=A0A5B9MKC2_9BACT|nr:FG-GAP-like repeat-containing protein [Stieleria maiorica]QEG00427.1 FG-GAP repeat protein [Stieleria maiorica]